MICKGGSGKWEFRHRSLQAAAMIVVAGLTLTGCRKPITQHPLSLNLPGPVGNLTAIRGDNQIWLTWTMPQKTTDNHRIRDDVTVQVCRRAGMAGACVNAGNPVVLASGATGSFSEMLPPDLASGTPEFAFWAIDSRLAINLQLTKRQLGHQH